MTKIAEPTFADTFANLWKMFCPEQPFVQEFEFHPTRRFKFDFAWPSLLIAVEMEGGIWTGGRHTRGKTYARDCIKYNAATLAGWKVLRYTTDDLKKRPFQVVEEVRGLVTLAASQRSRL